MKWRKRSHETYLFVWECDREIKQNMQGRQLSFLGYFFKNLFISAFVDSTIRNSQIPCLTIGYNWTRYNSQIHPVLSNFCFELCSGLILTLPAILGLTHNPQRGSALTPDSIFSVSLPSSSLLSSGEWVLRTAYINWERGLRQFLGTPMNNNM